MIRIRSNLKLSIRSLRQWDSGMAERIQRGLYRALLVTAARTQTAYLQGPRPRHLGEVTTALRRSINARVLVNAGRVLGYVGTNIPYAPFHEFGFSGSQNVRAHSRVIRFRVSNQMMLFTRKLAVQTFKSLKRYAVRDARGHIVGYRAHVGRKLARITIAQQAHVRAHSRRIHYLGRPFLRPALQDTFRSITDAVTTAASGEPDTLSTQ